MNPEKRMSNYSMLQGQPSPFFLLVDQPAPLNLENKKNHLTFIIAKNIMYTNRPSLPLATPNILNLKNAFHRRKNALLRERACGLQKRQSPLLHTENPSWISSLTRDKRISSIFPHSQSRRRAPNHHSFLSGTTSLQLWRMKSKLKLSNTFLINPFFFFWLSASVAL